MRLHSALLAILLTVSALPAGRPQFRGPSGSGTSGYSSSPVAAGGRLYITSEEGVTHVLQAGKELRELARNELGETAMAPAVSDGVLYIRGRAHVYAIGARP
jgi:outer membrane protein assembly factor BamB